jgi:sugar (pentulose or hexulose) kinase
MSKIPVIAIFDVGKTNKKFLLFDEQYKVVHEESTQLKETEDEDGFPCEDVFALTEWIKNSFDRITCDYRFYIKAVNFSAYGASFVYVNQNGNPITPLYNYLKPYPEKLKEQFYSAYGGESLLSKQTASPVLGNLNSGLQLYRLKYEKPELFKQMAFALHLPQYLSYVLIDYPATDITSIGCHTKLWNYQKNKYHRWVEEEGIEKYFAPVISCTAPFSFERNKKSYVGGIGLHDSSSALIPYLSFYKEPFLLLSTGTWCISLNPFNHSLLTDYELQHDCLCYLSYEGKPVKASRFFAGQEHEQQVKRLANHFNTGVDQFRYIKIDYNLIKKMGSGETGNDSTQNKSRIIQSEFSQRDLNDFATYEEAYHQLVANIIEQQVRSINLVLKGTTVNKIFVDGGFSNNPLYMYLLAASFPGFEIYTASISQASAFGAALAIHPHWNSKILPAGILELELHTVKHGAQL